MSSWAVEHNNSLLCVNLSSRWRVSIVDGMRSAYVLSVMSPEDSNPQPDRAALLLLLVLLALMGLELWTLAQHVGKLF